MQTSTKTTVQILAALAFSGAACYGQVTFNQIHLFPEPGPSAPECTLVETSPGVFYGTTSTGSGGPSTLFMVTSTGTFQIVHTFETSEGVNPSGTLTQVLNGTIYGVTTSGGANGFGTIFRSDLSGNITVVYNFTEPTDYYPTPYSLIQATDGRLYGTIGSNLSTAYVLGEGRSVALHFFSQAEGIVAGPLTQAADGNLYGLTSVGIYQLTTAGQFKMIYTFTGEDGTNPDGNLTQASNGRLYGVNSFGGANNYGTAFSVSTQGDFRVEHAFTGEPSDLGFPFTGTARADDGNIYGAAGLGGGSLFQITTAGDFTTLVDFPGSIPGGDPNFPSPAVVLQRRPRSACAHTRRHQLLTGKRLTGKQNPRGGNESARGHRRFVQRNARRVRSLECALDCGHRAKLRYHGSDLSDHAARNGHQRSVVYCDSVTRPRKDDTAQAITAIQAIRLTSAPAANQSEWYRNTRS